jgi:hypothetical protein
MALIGIHDQAETFTCVRFSGAIPSVSGLALSRRERHALCRMGALPGTSDVPNQGHTTTSCFTDL